MPGYEYPSVIQVSSKNRSSETTNAGKLNAWFFYLARGHEQGSVLFKEFIRSRCLGVRHIQVVSLLLAHSVIANNLRVALGITLMHLAIFSSRDGLESMHNY